MSTERQQEARIQRKRVHLCHYFNWCSDAAVEKEKTAKKLISICRDIVTHKNDADGEDIILFSISDLRTPQAQELKDKLTFLGLSYNTITTRDLGEHLKLKGKSKRDFERIAYKNTEFPLETIKRLSTGSKLKWRKVDQGLTKIYRINMKPFNLQEQQELTQALSDMDISLQTERINDKKNYFQITISDYRKLNKSRKKLHDLIKEEGMTQNI